MLKFSQVQIDSSRECYIVDHEPFRQPPPLSKPISLSTSKYSIVNSTFPFPTSSLSTPITVGGVIITTRSKCRSGALSKRNSFSTRRRSESLPSLRLQLSLFHILGLWITKRGRVKRGLSVGMQAATMPTCSRLERR